MAHPYESQAKSSNARRLRALGAKAGKAWGSSSMFHAKGYPKTNAGTERPMTLEGGSSRKRADRKASKKYANGGSINPGIGDSSKTSSSGGGGSKKARHKGGVTNIIIAPGQGGGGPRPVPVPVPRPVPVPVRPGMPPIAPRPGIPPGAGAGPGPGAAPVNVNVPPPAAAAPPMRPPGMKHGGAIKKQAGGPTGYKGYPHSPTTEVDAAVSKAKKGGAIKKKQIGGPLGARSATVAGTRPGRFARRGPRPTGPAPGGPPATPAGVVAGLGRPGAPSPAAGAGAPPAVPLTGGRPRMDQGIRAPIYGKKGGNVTKGHSDEAEDKKLISRMLKQEERKEKKTEKKQDGGSVDGDDSYDDGISASSTDYDDTASSNKSASNQLSKMGTAAKTAADVLKQPASSQNPAQAASNAAQGAASVAGSAGTATGAMLNKPAAQFAGLKGAVPGSRNQTLGDSSKFQLSKKGGRVKYADGGFTPTNATSADPALPASIYHNQGTGYQRGGRVKHAGAAGGLGRLAKIPAARAVPAKTEI